MSSIIGLSSRDIASQLTGRGIHSDRFNREASSIYAQAEWSDADYGVLISRGKPMPQEMQAQTERNPTARQELKSEAFAIRARLQLRL